MRRLAPVFSRRASMEEQREECYLQLIRSAAQRLTGHERRSFVAEVTQTLCDDNPRQSERLFGWGRETVALGNKQKITYPKLLSRQGDIRYAGDDKVCSCGFPESVNGRATRRTLYAV